MIDDGSLIQNVRRKGGSFLHEPYRSHGKHYSLSRHPPPQNNTPEFVLLRPDDVVLQYTKTAQKPKVFSPRPDQGQCTGW